MSWWALFGIPGPTHGSALVPAKLEIWPLQVAMKYSKRWRLWRRIIRASRKHKLARRKRRGW